MNKSMSSRIFFSFLFLVAVIFAVLGLVIGQLFPFYVEDYVQSQNDVSQQSMEQFIQQEHIVMTNEQQKKLMQINELSYNQEQLQNMKIQFEFVLIFLFAIAIIVLGVFTYKMLHNFVEPLNNITKTARELEIGNYRARAFANGPKTIVDLRNSINILARNLQDMTKTREIEDERLKTLIENMGSALMMIDREGQV